MTDSVHPAHIVREQLSYEVFEETCQLHEQKAKAYADAIIHQVFDEERR